MEKRDFGIKLIPLKSQVEEASIAIYYILATAEASSNLGRYDGIHYGRRSKEAKNLEEIYVKSRTEGFGPEVRRRILLGTFVLSSGYYDAYYKKARLAQKVIQKEYNEFFQKVDFILSPTSPITAFAFGERKEPLSMYRSDLFTIPAALAGLPSISIKGGLDTKGLPIGLQFTAAAFADQKLLEFTASLEENIPQCNLDYTHF